MNISELIPVTYAGQKVLTGKCLAEILGCSPNRLRDNLRHHKADFIPGKHFFKITGSALTALKDDMLKVEDALNNPALSSLFNATQSLILWTKDGCQYHCNLIRKPEVTAAFNELCKLYFVEDSHNDAIALFDIPEFGQLRWVIIDGDPWFVVADLCRILDIQNPSDVVAKQIEDNEKMKINENGVTVDPRLNCSPFMHEINVVNEPGLYRLIFLSRKDNAKKFQRIIYHEILPSIRKKGYYVAPNAKMPTDTFQPQIDELKETVAALEIIYREVMEGKLSALECADKLVAVAKDIQNPDSKDKVLLQAANFIIGKKIF